jgi:hypothetical protein
VIGLITARLVTSSQKGHSDDEDHLYGLRVSRQLAVTPSPTIWIVDHIPPAPIRFAGTLAELYTKHMSSVLLKPDLIQRYHNLLKQYCEHRLGPLLVRHEGIKERATTYRARADGWPIVWTDNAPARAMHLLLFQEEQLDLAAFLDFLKEAPCTILEAWANIPKSVSAAGWYIAHINGVKGLAGSAKTCSTSDVIARFIRNVHPCNYFYVPKNGRWYGEQQDVINFVAERFQSLYNDTWSEFQQLAKDKRSPVRSGLGELPVEFELDANASALAPQAAQVACGPSSKPSRVARERSERAPHSRQAVRNAQDQARSMEGVSLPQGYAQGLWAPGIYRSKRLPYKSGTCGLRAGIGLAPELTSRHAFVSQQLQTSLGRIVGISDT